MIFVRPSRTAFSARLASGLTSTYHWSVSQGSITTSERSPCGTVWACGSTLARKPRSAISATTALRAAKRSSPCRAQRLRVRRRPGEEVLVAVQRQPGLAVEDVDDAELVALADLEIVEVMRRRDLDRAGALLRVGIVVADDRDDAADQRQDRVPADQGPSVSFSGWTATPVSPSIVSGRVVATVMKVEASSAS